MQTAINKPVQKKLYGNKILAFLGNINPFRTELVEVNVKTIGNRIVYTYTKIKEGN